MPCLVFTFVFIFCGCRVRTLPVSIRPAALPQDRSTVFQSLLRGEPVVPLGSPDSLWQGLADPPAAVESSAEGIRLTSAAGARAWVSPHLPVIPLDAASEETAAGQLEELTWEATITIAPQARFFIVCELRFAGEPGALLMQATPFDIQLFQDAERPGGGTSLSVSQQVADGRPHFWRLRLSGARLELRLDGSTVWQSAWMRPLARVAFGETRSDALHGGSMLLRDVVYVRRPTKATGS